MPDNENSMLEALDALRSSAESVEPLVNPGPKAAPPKPIAAESAPPPPPAVVRRTARLVPADPPAATAERTPRGPGLRCLACGYPLQAETDLRCSECGRQWTRAEMDHWFAGAEQRRFADVIWWTQVVLIAQVFLVPELIGLPMMGGGVCAGVAVVAAGWACWLANRGRWFTTVGRYGNAALVLTGLSLLRFWPVAGEEPGFSQDSVYAVSLAMVAPLLVLAMVDHPPKFYSAGRARRLLLPATLVSACALWWLPILGDLTTIIPNFEMAGYSISLFDTLPRVLTVVTWMVAWVWLRRVRRALFDAH